MNTSGGTPASLHAPLETPITNRQRGEMVRVEYTSDHQWQRIDEKESEGWEGGKSVFATDIIFFFWTLFID